MEVAAVDQPGTPIVQADLGPTQPEPDPEHSDESVDTPIPRTRHATIGLGTIGLFGNGGVGQGYSGPVANPIPPSPVVRHSNPVITGSLDRDIIRRIVRMHSGEIRYCYKSGLTKNSSLAGKLTIEFVIGGNGRVESVIVAKPLADDTLVGLCVAKAFKRWIFPEPTDGGVVTVSYPLTLTPD